jgi:hypothetical protein
VLAGLAMKITGQEIETGVRDWIKDELKNGPNREYDLGKFFFSVGTGTLGFLFVAEKLVNTAKWDTMLVVSFVLLLAGIVQSLIMVVPKRWEIDEATDLFDRRQGIIERTIREAYTWFALWVLGSALGVFAVLT